MALTPTDIENLRDMIEIVTERGEDDSDVLNELALLDGRLEKGEPIRPSEAATLREVAREFVEAWENEPGAKDDPGRADYTGLMDRLSELAGE